MKAKDLRAMDEAALNKELQDLLKASLTCACRSLISNLKTRA
mgnify:CR=1 FL=1